MIKKGHSCGIRQSFITHIALVNYVDIKKYDNKMYGKNLIVELVIDL